MRISPSQVQSFDLCQRRWAFKIIEGFPEPTSQAQQEGILGHKRVEGLLKRGDHPGDDALGKLVQAAMRPGILPAPGPHLLVEHEFSIPLNDRGDAFYGFIDCVAPPENGRVLVTDNKFTSSLEWAKTPAELAADAQHVGYSRAALELFPGQAVREVEGRWIYLEKNSTRVKPVSLVRTTAQVIEAWGPVERKAHAMLELRKRKVPAEQLEGNPEACSMYGKTGCPYRNRCSVGRGLGKFDFGARKNLFTANEKGGIAPPSQQGDQQMAIPLFEQLQAMKNKLSPAQAPGVNTVLAALQRAKGATGVNPPPAPAQAAPAPAPSPAPTQDAPAQASTASGLAARLGLGGAKPSQAAPAQAIPPPAPAPAQAEIPAAEAPAPAQAAPAQEASPVLEAAKKTRRPKTNGAPPSQPKGENRSQLTVLYNVAIVKRPGDNADPVQLVELLAPIMRQVADEASVSHWSLIPYAQGRALLAHAFDKWLEESDWKGTIYVNGRSEEAYAVKAVLDAHADVVCTGLA